MRRFHQQLEGTLWRSSSSFGMTNAMYIQHHMGENEYWYPKCRQAWAAQQVYRTQFWSFLYWQRNINVWSWLESLAHFPCIPQWSQDRQAFHVSKESSMPEMLCSPLDNAFPRHRHGQAAPRHGNRALTAPSGASCTCQALTIDIQLCYARATSSMCYYLAIIWILKQIDEKRPKTRSTLKCFRIHIRG